MRWVRLIAVLVLGVVVVLPGLYVVAWLSFAGARFAWLPTMLLFAAVGVGIAWLAVDRRWAQYRLAGVLLLGVLGAVLGVVCAHSAPASTSRLGHEIDAVVPAGWRQVDESTSGNAICFDSCTEVDRTFVVDGDPSGALRDAGCTKPVAPVDPVSWRCDRGRDVDFRVTILEDGKILVSASASG